MRAIDGFSLALVEDNIEQPDEAGRNHLAQVRSSAKRMEELIDELLQLSRITRSELRRESVNISNLAQEVLDTLQKNHPERTLTFDAQADLMIMADRRLMRVVLENLLSNAWKFTSKTQAAHITFGVELQLGLPVYFIRDNGAGFDMKYTEKLFNAFQRLHSEAEFPGIGVGLATVHRVIDRHHGKIWAEGKEGFGATFFFTVPND